MAGETILIYQLTGAGPTYNEPGGISAIRFCSNDTYNPGLTYPCKVPPVGTPHYCSYWITLIMHYSGTFSLINNARMWGPGNIKDTWFSGDKGRMIVPRKDAPATDHGFLVASYQQAGGTPGLDGYGIKDGAPNGHAQYNTQALAVVDVDDLSESSYYQIDTTDIVAEGYSKAWLVQTETFPGATHGELTPITLVVAVDVV